MTKALKDIYSKEFIFHFAGVVKQVYQGFHAEVFCEMIFEGNWKEKALKERMRHITRCLHQTLPPDYREAIDILLQTVPYIHDQELAYLFLPDFVEAYGLDDWETSISALETFTQYTTSEFAVRPFILKDQERMVIQMAQWAVHSNHRVRRLASEGCRPRLPWGMALQGLKGNPLPVISVLENLKQDESLYVRKSVANNLNDISKDHPDFVLRIAKEWYGSNPYTDWIVKHACRTLLKQGNKQALSLFGFENAYAVQVEDFSLDTDRVRIGDSLHFSFRVIAEDEMPCTVRIEYAVDFVKAKGHRSKRMFKIAENVLRKGSALVYNRKQNFKDLTTRKHYAGVHTLSILINGEVKASKDFIVE
ncbi:hypothetical protein [Ectobacillus panaciterrae]|uniref:hypothetical protein n=1 Tax=Ectobacillus panaciterrae TaxID=363872 RepID=UPI00040FAE82|nr:hypothetical protein [Ectobacillus panaciterrae]